MSNWPKKTLGSICRIEMGRTPSRGDSKGWDAGFKTSNHWVSIADLTACDGRVLTKTKERISDFAAKTSKVVPAGTLMMSFKLSIGKLAFAGCDLFTNEAIVAFHLNEESDIDPIFLYWALSVVDWSALTKGSEKVKGATMNKAKLNQIEIPVPSLEEQKRIVALLDAATARIGVCTEVSSTEIQLASNLYQARVEEILSADALKGVREVALGSLIELVIDHRGKTPNKLGGDFTESGVPVVSAIHIKDDSIKWSERYRYVTYEMFERWMPVRLAKGDILLTSEAPLGQVARIESDDPLVLSQRLFALRANSSLVTGDYLFEFLRSPFGQERLRARATGATAVGIRQAELMKVMVPVPRLEDQPEMIQEIQDARQTTMDFKSQIRGRVLLLKNLYQSILESAFAGDL